MILFACKGFCFFAAICGVLGRCARVVPNMRFPAPLPSGFVPRSRGVVPLAAKLGSPAIDANGVRAGQAVATAAPARTSDVKLATVAKFTDIVGSTSKNDVAGRLQSEIITGTGQWAASGAGLVLGQRPFFQSMARRNRVVRAATQKTTSVQLLADDFKDELRRLRAECSDISEQYNDAYLLRFLIQHNGDVFAAADNVRNVTAWRDGEGRPLVDAAASAVAKATAGGGWDNNPVLAAAPHSDKIASFLLGKQVVVSTKEGDIISLIRAGTIDTQGLMDAVSVDEMVEFFIYGREVNFIVMSSRTEASGRLCKYFAANDLTGVRGFPDKRFQSALSKASEKAVELYPGFTEPTVLLNLPFLARALIGLLLPLFPGTIRDKVKFATFKMDYMEKLTDVLNEPTKSKFIDDFEKVLAS